MSKISEILNQPSFSLSDLEQLLRCEGEDMLHLLGHGGRIKEIYTGNKVYFRGLIEFSNICQKDCFYCGIRRSSSSVQRYNLTDQEILDAARFADECKFGSIVLQSGENSSLAFAERISNLIRQIKQQSNGRLGITLSVGEQTESVYRQWFEAGPHRYLLRIETTNQTLFRRIHPQIGRAHV